MRTRCILRRLRDPLSAIFSIETAAASKLISDSSLPNASRRKSENRDRDQRIAARGNLAACKNRSRARGFIRDSRDYPVSAITE